MSPSVEGNDPVLVVREACIDVFSPKEVEEMATLVQGAVFSRRTGRRPHGCWRSE